MYIFTLTANGIHCLFATQWHLFHFSYISMQHKQENSLLHTVSVDTSMHKSYVVITVPALVSPAQECLCKSRQVPSHHCCPRWHHVKHCVENCLHCGWGGMYCHDACLYKRLKTGYSIVDNVRNGLYSDRPPCVCVCVLCTRGNLWQISDRCRWKCLAWNFIRLLLRKLRTSAGFLWNKCRW